MSTNHTIRQIIIDENIPLLVKSLTGFHVSLFISNFSNHFLTFEYIYFIISLVNLNEISFF